MSKREWFSARIRRVCQIDGTADLANDSVFVFKAQDFDSAFGRILEIGHRAEEEYRNHEGKLVSWKFAEVISLDIIQREDLDGAEVYSVFIDFDAADAQGSASEFSPKKSEPTQTI